MPWEAELPELLMQLAQCSCSRNLPNHLITLNIHCFVEASAAMVQAAEAWQAQAPYMQSSDAKKGHHGELYQSFAKTT